ncbi:hypothetical protein ABIB38_004659 [Massilia sp. UYP11]|uniref:hypothetical protein n=1 Tax=Massilia sp. UYP11 TaxID=1756385 RepID=UPI003D21E6ED
MKEEVTNRYANATASREALERERESADPDRRAAIDAQLVTTRDTEHAARRELDELNGFSGVPAVEPAAEIQQAQEQQAQQAQAPETVRQKEYTSGNRFTGALGALKSERMVETHTHIDIVEARIANARTEQVREQLAGEKAQADAAKERAAEAKEVDRVRAERVFEGGHAPGELGTQDYLRMESDHRKATVDYAQRAADQEKREEAEAEAVAALSEETGIEHVILAADAMIEGEIVAEAVVRDESYFAVEFSDESGKPVRALVPAAGHSFSIGDEIQVERKLGYHIDASYGYGR